MELVRHETCLEYFRRRLSEGWKCISLEGYNAVLLSPEGIRRELDLRNDVETLRPDAPGDTTGLFREGDTANWKCVDDVTPDEDDTYVAIGGDTTSSDLYNLPVHTGSGTINKITVFSRCRRRDAALGDGLELIKTGGTTYQGTIHALTTSYDDYSTEWAQNPGNAHAWTWDEIDALQIGIELRSQFDAETRCTQLYVEVDTPVVAKKHTFSLDPRPHKRMRFHPNLKLG